MGRNDGGIKKYRHGAVRRRLMVSYLLLAVIPVLICGFSMEHFISANVSANSTREAQKESETVKDTITLETGRISYCLDNLRSSTAIRKVFTDGFTDDTAVYNTLFRLTSLMRDKADFTLYDRDGKALYGTRAQQDLPAGWGLLQKADGSYETVMRADRIDDEDVLAFALAVRNEQDDIIGYACAFVDDACFDEIFDGLLSLQENLAIVDSTFEPVYASRDLSPDGTLQKLRRTMIVQGELPSRIDDLDLMIYPVGETGLYQIFLRPAVFRSEIRNVMYMTVGILAAVSIGLCWLAAWFESRRFTKPLENLNKAADRIRLGDLSAQIHSQRTDEFGEVSDKFDLMASQLDAVVEEDVRQEKELVDVRITMLQAQLNPHFLYNTLDTMKWMAKKAKADGLASMTGKLAKLLRASISGEPFIPLQEEFLLCKEYAEIQNIRFEDRYHVTFELSEDVQLIPVPKLILQPLLENALKHGIREDGKGNILVKAEQKDAQLYLTVKDNGTGMPLEMLERIRDHRWSGLQGHIGLKNVDTILRLYYGDDYGIHACIPEEGGTEMTIILPLRKGEDHVQSPDRG